MFGLLKALLVFLLVVFAAIAQARAPITDAQPVAQRQLDSSSEPSSSSMVSLPGLQQQIKKLEALLAQQQQQMEKQQQQITSLQKQLTTLNKQVVTLRHHAVAAKKPSVASNHHSKVVAASTVNTSETTVVNHQPKTSSATRTATPTVTSDKNADQAYNDAFAFVKKQQYDKAIEDLQVFVKQYPHNQHNADAYYWLGQLYTINNNTNNAKTYFLQLINEYPTSEYTPDAMLELGVLALEQQQWQEAKQWFNKIIKNYPDTKAAKLAEAKLKTLS
ncbi:MAG: tol-pal system protein YbgF [Pseudomonadota bacterium]